MTSRHLRSGASRRRLAAVAAAVLLGLTVAPTHLAVRLIARSYVTTLEDLDRPWAELERLVPGLQVEPVALGGAYIAWGRKADPPPGRRRDGDG